MNRGAPERAPSQKAAMMGRQPRTKGEHVGSLVTLDLPADSPVLSLPWIITFGPLSDEEDWEPVVCGPYERAHALSLAETVVADEELMAVVEPVLPHTTVDQIRTEIASARLAAEEEEDEEYEGEDAEYEEFDEEEGDESDDLEVEVDDEYDEQGEEEEVVEPTPPPSPDEVRAGFARIAARLAGS
jgi:hypothetical protein